MSPALATGSLSRVCSDGSLPRPGTRGGTTKLMASEQFAKALWPGTGELRNPFRLTFLPPLRLPLRLLPFTLDPQCQHSVARPRGEPPFPPSYQWKRLEGHLFSLPGVCAHIQLDPPGDEFPGFLTQRQLQANVENKLQPGRMPTS